MAGNTRGKLKEHFEGVHRNMDWSMHHIAASLQLLDVQLRQTEAVQVLSGGEEEVIALIEKHPLYAGIKALGEGITTLDKLAQDVYASF